MLTDDRGPNTVLLRREPGKFQYVLIEGISILGAVHSSEDVSPMIEIFSAADRFVKVVPFYVGHEFPWTIWTVDDVNDISVLVAGFPTEKDAIYVLEMLDYSHEEGERWTHE